MQNPKVSAIVTTLLARAERGGTLSLDEVAEVIGAAPLTMPETITPMLLAPLPAVPLTVTVPEPVALTEP